ncbi:MAG: flagellar biosynthesis protein FlhB [Lachnospiraceae bacterium]|jgi:flagellar biosynthetic protein FlhB|nr:flagellar biosynthesis protein FlhB [Lachnospiraceae bacterium]
MIELRLQFFADGPGGEKTEDATPKKLNDARKEGKVAKSKEIGNGLTLLALFVVLKIFLSWIGNRLGELFAGVYNRIPDMVQSAGNKVPESNFHHLFLLMMIRALLIMAPVLLVGFLVAFLSDLLQVGWHPTGKPLQPKPNKLSPISGFKRIFSVNSVAELVKSIAKILLIAIVSYSYLKNQHRIFFVLLDMPVTQATLLIGQVVVDLGMRIAIVYMLIALGDFIYQKRKFANDMKMTKQEVKDEMKDQEGNPEIKGKQRQRMQEASRRRMMQRLPEADVVITNPTHYAVAIKYDPDVNEAPVVLAKGADYLAQRIKEIARENKIEIVENKPLARMLYANVDIDAEVPPELYQAVAEVLAYVYHLQGR